MHTVKDVLLKAKEYEQSGEYDKAIKFYQAVIDRMPDTKYAQYSKNRMDAIKAKTVEFDFNDIENKQDAKHIVQNKKLLNNIKNKMFNAFLLNIFSAIIPILMIVLSFIATSGTQTEFEVTVPKAMEIIQSIAMYSCLAIVIIGFVIYFSKSFILKKHLTYIYLIAAIVDLVIWFIGTYVYLFVTCGIFIVAYIPNILQIIAGRKFLSAVRDYKNER